MTALASRKKSIFKRTDRVLGSTAVAFAAASGAGLVSTPAQAAIIYSGPVNIAIPNNIDGVYMNLITGATSTASFAGYDINPYSAAAGNFNLWGPTATTWAGGSSTGPFVQPIGSIIDGADSYFRPGGGTNVGLEVTLNAPNYFGVQFTNEGTSQINFGWVEITFGADAGTRSITQYAYEDTGLGIAITPVPEPSSMSLLAVGAAGLAWRRKRNRNAAVKA